MKINWEQTKGNSFQSARGTDEHGNSYFMTANREICTCTTPDGFKGQGWTAEEAFHNAHLEGMNNLTVPDNDELIAEQARMELEKERGGELTSEQITKLANEPAIQATIEANKAQTQPKRESDLMLLGYNQALLDYGQLPEGWETQDMIRTINEQKAKLGIE